MKAERERERALRPGCHCRRRRRRHHEHIQTDPKFKQIVFDQFGSGRKLKFVTIMVIQLKMGS